MRALICLLFLAACGASPAPQYFGATRSEVVKGGITFVVFHKDNRVEVVRLGYLTRRERAAVPDLMVQAALGIGDVADPALGRKSRREAADDVLFRAGALHPVDMVFLLLVQKHLQAGSDGPQALLPDELAALLRDLGAAPGAPQREAP